MPWLEIGQTGDSGETGDSDESGKFGDFDDSAKGTHPVPFFLSTY